MVRCPHLENVHSTSSIRYVPNLTEGTKSFRILLNKRFFIFYFFNFHTQLSHPGQLEKQNKEQNWASIASMSSIKVTSCNHRVPNPLMRQLLHPYSSRGFAWPSLYVSPPHYWEEEFYKTKDGLHKNCMLKRLKYVICLKYEIWICKRLACFRGS